MLNKKNGQSQDRKKERESEREIESKREKKDVCRVDNLSVV